MSAIGELLTRYLLFSLPESIIVSLAIVYLMQIKCTRPQRIIAIFFTSIISFACQVLLSEVGVTVIIGSFIISIVNKAWYDYSIKFWNYWLTTIFILVMLLVTEIIIYIPIVLMLGLDVMQVRHDMIIMTLLTIPLRTFQSFLLYLLHRRYYKNV